MLGWIYYCGIIRSIRVDVALIIRAYSGISDVESHFIYGNVRSIRKRCKISGVIYSTECGLMYAKGSTDRRVVLPRDSLA